MESAQRKEKKKTCMSSSLKSEVSSSNLGITHLPLEHPDFLSAWWLWYRCSGWVGVLQRVVYPLFFFFLFFNFVHGWESFRELIKKKNQVVVSRKGRTEYRSWPLPNTRCKVDLKRFHRSQTRFWVICSRTTLWQPNCSFGNIIGHLNSQKRDFEQTIGT